MAWASLWIAAASGAGPVGKTDIALVGDVETHGFRTGGAEEAPRSARTSLSGTSTATASTISSWAPPPGTIR
jgi:hypothetical protein